jgi:glycosyltransferase involved in cell wall biosynthesis
MLPVDPPRPDWMPNPVRVSILTPCLWVGGVEMWILQLCRWLDPSRFTVTNVFVGGPMHSHTHPAMLGMFPRSVNIHADLKLTLDTSDVIICWGRMGSVPIIEQHPCKMVYTLHGARKEPNWPVIEESMLWRMRKKAKLVAVCEAGRDLYPEEVRHDVQVLPNAADESRLGRYAESPAAFKARLRIPADKKVALFIGRSSAEKNVQLAIDAIGLLPDWVLVIAGAIGTKLLPRYNTVQISTQAHIGDLLSIADVYLQTSDTEAHSIAINEAWLAGVPVVCTDFRSAQLFNQKHGPMAITMPVRCAPAAAVPAILRGASEEGKQMARHAQAVAREHYSAIAFGRRWSSYLWSEVMKLP